MIVDVTVPELGESITEVEIGEWLVAVGDRLRQDDEVVAIESDKATVEVPAPRGGILVEILKEQGGKAIIGEVIGRIDTEAGLAAEKTEAAAPPEGQPSPSEGQGASDDLPRAEMQEGEKTAPPPDKAAVMPAAARILAQHDIPAQEVTATGPGGRLLKEDAQRSADERKRREPAAGEPAAAESPALEERRVPMTPIRRTIAARLLEAKQSMALLTTFNEADMSAVKNMRAAFGQAFADKHGVRLGFMSFFVKAAVAALLDFPLVNARIDGDDIVYHGSCDIGVAIGGGKGLVVPVLRRAETMSFAEIERQIGVFAERAKKNTLTMDELKGGTFTISNGGIYGSMLSTPIVNPPQSAILGLHAINDRPVVVDGEIVIRPVMYLALSYDHRIIDGREAVTFLKSIKERVEQPHKLLLEV